MAELIIPPNEINSKLRMFKKKIFKKRKKIVSLKENV